MSWGQNQNCCHLLGFGQAIRETFKHWTSNPSLDFDLVYFFIYCRDRKTHEDWFISRPPPDSLSVALPAKLSGSSLSLLHLYEERSRESVWYLLNLSSCLLSLSVKFRWWLHVSSNSMEEILGLPWTGSNSWFLRLTVLVDCRMHLWHVHMDSFVLLRWYPSGVRTDRSNEWYIIQPMTFY